MGKSTISMAIFNSYVSSPEGTPKSSQSLDHFSTKTYGDDWGSHSHRAGRRGPFFLGPATRERRNLGYRAWDGSKTYEITSWLGEYTTINQLKSRGPNMPRFWLAYWEHHWDLLYRCHQTWTVHWEYHRTKWWIIPASHARKMGGQRYIYCHILYNYIIIYIVAIHK